KEDGLYLNPNVPKELGRIRFRFTWRDSLLEVVMEEDNIEVRKISGPSRNIFIKGEKILMPQKAVLFDLDGVLTSTSDNHYEAWKKMMKELGHDLPREFKDRLRGISRMESLELILDYFNLQYPSEEKEELAMKKNDYYKDSIRSFTSRDLYPGAINILNKLREMDVRIGLVSASKNALGLIKNMKIEDCFDIIVDPNELKRGKPHPDPFLKAADMLDMDPGDCLGVEDARSGIESINAANMTSLGIGGRDLENAYFLYPDIESAYNFIINWVEGDYGKY